MPDRGYHGLRSVANGATILSQWPSDKLEGMNIRQLKRSSNWPKSYRAPSISRRSWRPLRQRARSSSRQSQQSQGASRSATSSVPRERVCCSCGPSADLNQTEQVFVQFKHLIQAAEPRNVEVTGDSSENSSICSPTWSARTVSKTQATFRIHIILLVETLLSKSNFSTIVDRNHSSTCF